MSKQEINLGTTEIVNYNGDNVKTLKLNNDVIWESNHMIISNFNMREGFDGNAQISLSSGTGIIKYKLGDDDWVEGDSIIYISEKTTATKLEIKGDFTGIEQDGVLSSGSTTEHYSIQNIEIKKFGGNLVRLGDYMFNTSKLSHDVILPSFIREIGNLVIVGDVSAYKFDWLGDLDNVDAQSGKWNFSNSIDNNGVKVINGIALNITDVDFTSALTLNSGIKYLANYLFKDKSNLLGINFNNDLEIIGESCFENCNNSSFTTFTIPSTVNKIGKGAFATTVLTTITFNQAPDKIVELPEAGKNDILSIKGMFYSKTARNITIITDNYIIANYDYDDDNMTATINHINGTAWNKTTTPTLSLNGNILTISGSNADKYKISCNNVVVTTSSTTINIQDTFTLTSGTNYTIKVWGVKDDTSYIRSDSASITYTAP